MRLDLVIKHSRIIKRRTIASEYCNRGLVLVNGKVAKPSKQVKDKDVITIYYGERVIVFSVELVEQGRKLHITYNLISDTKNNKSDA